MTALSIVLYIVLILISLVLSAAVLMQQGQRQGLGAIAGGAETFFGKGKSKGVDAKLAKITKIAAAVFIVLAIVTTLVVAQTNDYTTNVYVDGTHMHLEDGSTVELADATEEQLALVGLTPETAAAYLAEYEAALAATEGEAHDDHVHQADGTITDAEGNVITEEEAHGTAAEATAEPAAEATAEPAAEATAAAE